MAEPRQGQRVVRAVGAMPSVGLSLLRPCAHPSPGACHPLQQIILSVAEHHSNLVPWQMLAQRTGAVLK